MGRAPCCDKANVKKGPWSPEEDLKLKDYIEKHGTGGTGLLSHTKLRCGKSCRLRWLNYLRPNLKHGEFSDDEDRIICSLFASIGSRWSIIAAQLPGRTDNDIKNYWNTKLKKKLLGLLPPPPHQRKPLHDHHHQPQLPSPFGSSSSTSSTHHMTMMMNTSSSLISTITASPKNPTSSFALTDDDHHTPTCHEQLILPFQTHYEYCFPTQLGEFQSKPSLLMFGGREQSCTSSDASGSSTTTTNYNIPTAYHIHHHDHMGLPGSSSNFYTSSSTTLRSYGLFDEDNQKNLTTSGAGGGDDGGATGLWSSESTPMLMEYYSIEEIKQLINSSSTSSGCNNIVLPHFLNNDGNVINRGMNSDPRGDSCTSETVIS
ncbi:hypothetical protein H6P81_017743 [Aristolochia fimbriata]|uniref:Uncharacterized protein n=1 Tax=Aristolochia fimbriata TaxID=158543 RepID=A0AAV7DZH6_ARIFI|nr:hypothetical protein H6P81_017743 [Aristolochia fimbriata]